MVPASGVSTPRIGILTGPTATGKTGVAIEWALRHANIEIVNADSLLIYRGMDIGTAKPTLEERCGIVHHLIDVRGPAEPYTAGDFVRETGEAIAAIEAKGRRALIVGGTGFYLKALLYGLWDAPKSEPALRAELEKLETKALYEELERVDPESAHRISLGDRYRLVRAVEMIRLSGKTPSQLEAESPKQADPRFALWIIDREQAELEERIVGRTRAMLGAGLVEETRRLYEAHPGVRPLLAVGYEQTIAFLEGREPEGRKIRSGLSGLEDEIVLATRQLVKRQRTWFRGQTEGQWFKLDDDRTSLDRAFEETYA
jgi:tRNA dimethylallyltransferase